MLEKTHVWKDIADSIEAYIQDAQSGENQPSIDRYLPNEHGPKRNLVIVELAKIEMEQLASSGIRPSIDDYLIRYPELAECTGGAPLDLILEEIRLRMSSE